MANPLPKRVAILLPSLRFGGAERVALNLARAFNEASINVDFLLMCCEGEFLNEAARYGEVINLRCNRTHMLPLRLMRYLHWRHPDVLLSSFWKLNLCASIARILYPSVTLLLWEHSPPSKVRFIPNWLYSISATLLYRLATHVICVSAGVRNDVAALTLGLQSRLCVIPNPIFPPEHSLQRLCMQETCRRIVWVGRLDAAKNPMLALEAFSRVRTADTILVFVGDGSLRTVLDLRCSELGLAGRVQFVGYCAEPYNWMAVASLQLISSDREGLPSVAIEALMSGLRVVSTDCGEGIHEILLCGRLGTITPIGDADALAHAIDLELARPQTPAIQSLAGNRFLPQAVLKQFLLAMLHK